MVDFRKWFPAIAVVALAFGASTNAAANLAVPHPNSFTIQAPNASVDQIFNTVAFISAGTINTAKNANIESNNGVANSVIKKNNNLTLNNSAFGANLVASIAPTAGYGYGANVINSGSRVIDDHPAESNTLNAIAANSRAPGIGNNNPATNKATNNHSTVSSATGRANLTNPAFVMRA